MTQSLIEKLEAKICGNYSEKEAYGRGLDQGFRVAIDLIRQHEAQRPTEDDNHDPWYDPARGKNGVALSASAPGIVVADKNEKETNE